MANLSIYLPPFSSDYSGACSALFDFHCLIAINDASCCTTNYINYDEPRWKQHAKATLCTELRLMDAILGDDQRVVRRIAEAADALKPDFIAVLGSPVPALIGMDIPGVALEVQEQCGIPAFGFSTTGFSYYDAGIGAAAKGLLDHFASADPEKRPGSVNLLGLTPLDYAGEDSVKTLIACIESAGMTVNASLFMESDLKQCQCIGAAEVNLALTSAGLRTAKYLHNRFGTPWVAAAPIGTRYGESVCRMLRQSMEDGQCRAGGGSMQTADRHGRILLAGDQVVMGSLRTALWAAGLRLPMDVATFFGFDPALACQEDVFLKCERQLIELLSSGRYCGVIGDTLLTKIPAAKELQFLSLPHAAVSSCLYWDQTPVFDGLQMDRFLTGAVDILSNPFS